MVTELKAFDSQFYQIIHFMKNNHTYEMTDMGEILNWSLNYQCKGW